MKSRFGLLTALLIVCLLGLGVLNSIDAGTPISARRSLLKDYNSGELSLDTYTLYLAYLLTAPKQLPQKYLRKTGINKYERCGTPVMREIQKNLPRLSPQARAIVKKMMARPEYTNEKTYTSANFVVHYEDYPNDNSDYTYAKACANFAEEARDYFFYNSEDSDLNYDLKFSPFIDGTLGEVGTNKYDIYIRDLALINSVGTYGYLSTSDDGDEAISYMAINNNWLPDYYVKGEDAASITIAHEFFHAIQQVINPDEDMDRWWVEASATWCEDMIFDDVNGYDYYLDEFLPYPHLSLFASSGDDLEQPTHEYGANIFARFLSENYGEEIIKRIWEAHEDDTTSMNVIQTTLDSDPTIGFYSAFDGFLAANYTRDYEEADPTDVAAYPDVHVYETTSMSLSSVKTINHNSDLLPRGLGANYLKVIPSSTYQDHGDLTISFDGSENTPWSLQAIRKRDDDYDVVKLVFDTTDNTAVTTLNYFGNNYYSEVVLVPAALSVISELDEDFTYSYTLQLDKDTTPPANIADLAFTKVPYEVTLNWINPPELDYDAAMIRRSTTDYPASPGDGQLVSDVLTPLTEYVDNTVLDEDYYYTIFAHDNIPNYASGVSVLVEIPTDTTAPGAPTGFTPTSFDENTVTLSWSNPGDPDLKGIVLYRDTTAYPQTTGTKVYDGTGEQFSDKPLIDNTTYYYSAYAYDKAKQTNYSTVVNSVVTIPVDSNPPDEPGNLTRLPYNQRITFSWDKPINQIDLEGVRFLYSSIKYPTSETDGTEVIVPKGTHSYSISGLDNNTSYYFSISSYDEKPNYSTPPIQLIQQPDGFPPTIDLVILPNPVLAEYLTISVFSNEVLKPPSLFQAVFNGATSNIAMTDMPALAYTYKGSYVIARGSSGTITININVTDEALNPASASESITTKAVTTKLGAKIMNADNSVELSIPAKALANDANVTLLPVTQATFKTPLKIAGKGVNVYSPKTSFVDEVNLRFDYINTELKAEDEEKLGLYHLEGERMILLGRSFKDKKITIATKNTGIFALYVDGCAPTVTSMTPANGAKMNLRNPVISVTLDDIGVGVDPASLKIKVNDYPVPTAYDEKHKKLVARGFVVAEGQNAILIEAADKAGNKMTLASVANASGKVKFGKVFAYPNPAKDKVTLRYETEKSNVNIGLMIFDISGELVLNKRDIYRESTPVATLVYDYNWNCRNDRGQKIGSGIYIYRLMMTSEGKQDTFIGKLAVVR